MPALLLLTLLWLAPAPVHPGEVRLAVASNFRTTAQALAAAFEQRTGHRVRISSASSGKLYAQILGGAPFDLFLSADAERPRLLADRGRADPPRTYAVGRLVYWSPGTPGDEARCRRHLPTARRLALANPKTAPYGRAALEVLENLGLDPGARTLVTGENVGQAYAFVASGAVDGGFVAAAQLKRTEAPDGCRWPVPARLHEPVVQQAVLLARGRSSAPARAFYRYLFGDEARRRIRADGYDLP